MTSKNPRSVALISCAGIIFWPGAFIFGLPGVLRQYWQQNFSVGGGAVGGTVFFILAGTACLMYFSGRLQERYGPGQLTAFGTVVNGASAIWLSLASGIIDVYIWAFFVGAASAFLYLPGLTVVQRWYPARRGLVAGFFNMVFGFSAAIMSPIFSMLLVRIGYQPMLMGAGGVAIVVGLVASLWVRLPQDSVAEQSGEKIPIPADRSAGQALGSREFWCIWSTWVLAGAAGASMLVLATGFGLARGLPLVRAVVLLTAFNLTNGCGRLISGYYSDRIGRTRTMAVSFAGAGLAYLAMPHLPGLWLWAVLAAVIGFAFGTLFAVSGPLLSDCFGMAHFGAIFGMVFTGYGFVAGPVGPWLSGHILDLTRGNYTLVFSYLGLMYLGAAWIILLVRPMRACRIYG